MIDVNPAGQSFTTAYTDGGARGNPGPAGYGVQVVGENGEVLAELSKFLGHKTNNFAEYSALLGALEWALANGVERLRVVSDSELMVKQMKGQYKVASPDLKPLYDEARRRAQKLAMFRIEHVLRGKNKAADALANQAMDAGMGRGPSSNFAPPAAPTPSATRSSVTASHSPLSTPGSSPEISRTGLAGKPSVTRPRPLRGLVREGVIHLLEGEFPDGTLVLVMREKDLRDAQAG